MSAIAAWVKAEQPPLVKMATENQEIARKIVDNYKPYLRYISPLLIEAFRANRDRIVEEVWQDACRQDGELGTTARQYPDWFKGTCRRVLNLFLQAAGGG